MRKIAEMLGGAIAIAVFAGVGGLFAYIGVFKALPLALREWVWVSNGADPTVLDGAIFTVLLSLIVVVLVAYALKR